MIRPPDPDSPVESQTDSAKMASWLDSLKKCRGWSEWLEPKLRKDLENAKTKILDAVKTGSEPPEDACAQYRTLAPLFEMIETQQKKLS